MVHVALIDQMWDVHIADPRSEFTVDSLCSQWRHLITPLTCFWCLIVDEMDRGLELPIALHWLVERVSKINLSQINFTSCFARRETSKKEEEKTGT